MPKIIEPSMLLITATWQGHPSFKMIPVSKDCPYTECLFDSTGKICVVITKDTKTSLHMMPKLDDNGDPQQLKVSKRPNGKTVKESRVSLLTNWEHYIDNMDDVETLIKMFAVNADSFEYKKILNAPKVEMDAPSALL